MALAFVITHLAPGGSKLALGAELRSRLNGLYMATFFAGGAMGSALGAGAMRTGVGA